MRVPGFHNHKYKPPRLCTIKESNPERRFSVELLRTTTAYSTFLPPDKTITHLENSIEEGRRNVTLFKLAASIQAGGGSETAALAALLVENKARCRPPLEEAEVRRIARSAGRNKDTRPSSLKWEPFPVDVFPEPLRSFVVEGAKAMGCDPAYVAVPALVTIAAAIGTTRCVQLKTNWIEPSVIWAMMIGLSGSLKSPAFDYALSPLRILQSNRMREHRTAIELFERQCERFEEELRIWHSSGSRDSSTRPTRPEEPIATRYLASDVTVEAIAALLQANPRGLLVCRDEMSGWFESFGRYSNAKGADLAQWLEFHRAGYLIIDRKSATPPTIVVPLAAVSLTGTIQPGILQRALSRAHFESGLAARILCAMPPRSQKRWTDTECASSIIQSFSEGLSRLLTLDHGLDENGNLVPVRVPLEDTGQKAWIEFYDRHAQRQAEELDDDLAAAFSKLEGYAARFALVIFLFKCAVSKAGLSEAIDLESLNAGITLANWFANETKRIHVILETNQTSSDGLKDYIRSRGGIVTCRDIQRGPRRYRVSSSEVRSMLDQLCDAGKGEWLNAHPGSLGGQPMDTFRLFGDSGDGDSTPRGELESGVLSPSPVSPD